jgi:acetolactate synthase-1/2/3 large subunit
MEKYEGAEAFVEVLNANGVECIFFNPGSDTTPLQATILKYRASGKRAPKLILCLDESVAMTAAHGHYMVSGQPQVVMVHDELGTLQVGGAMQNAQWGRIPVILWAGEMPSVQRVNWLKEPFDQGSIMRNSVKWDHKLDSKENIHDVLQQAFRIAFTEPCGPVYLSYPWEILTEKFDRVAIPPSAPVAIASMLPADDDSLSKAAEILIEAENPLIVAGYSGRYPESVALLVELAQTLCAPVLSGLTRMNFPTTHPLSAGIEQIGGSRKANPYIADADVLLVIDYDTPYVPAEGFPRPEAKIIHIDIDPLTQGRPLWQRGADIFIEADSREAIPALSRIIRRRLTPEKRAKFRERFSQLERKHQKERKEWHTLGVNSSNQKPISPDWLGHCINEVVDEDTIIVNHTLSQSASVTEQIKRTKPGTLFGCAGGSIQWALGAAFGVKVAALDKTVVSLMTDGGFVWGCPVATLWSANSYHAPFLSVIFNNQSYGVVRGIVQRLYMTELSDQMAFEAGAAIMPPPEYALVAQACGGYGRMVADPADVLPALKEALKQVRNGKPAVVDVRLGKG